MVYWSIYPLIWPVWPLTPDTAAHPPSKNHLMAVCLLSTTFLQSYIPLSALPAALHSPCNLECCGLCWLFPPLCSLSLSPFLSSSLHPFLFCTVPVSCSRTSAIRVCHKAKWGCERMWKKKEWGRKKQMQGPRASGIECSENPGNAVSGWRNWSHCSSKHAVTVFGGFSITTHHLLLKQLHPLLGFSDGRDCVSQSLCNNLRTGTKSEW